MAIAVALTPLASATAATATTPAAATAAEPANTGADIAPIVVLLDTSGSMADDDGAGVIKLDGAKKAVNGIIQSLGGTSVFGFWTFPSGGDCGPGRFAVEPQRLTDPVSAIAKVNAQTADGQTPTGDALKAVADDLEKRGYKAATIVLVSDGLSNCGAPPCDVAKTLVSNGFDVTVPTIGFRTSTDGAKELACIAEATGAKTYSAGDSAELNTRLSKLVESRLTLSVDFTQRVTTGGSTTITAKVKQAAGQPAANVRLTLTLTDRNPQAPQQVVIPKSPQRRAATPPLVRLGNLPTGASRAFTWTLGTSATESATDFLVNAWGDNAAKVAYGGSYFTFQPSKEASLGGPLSGISNQHPLVIFGDSYSSGEGTKNYLPTPNGVSAACHRSSDTYLADVLPKTQSVVVACSGAVTNALTTSSDRSNRSQIQEMNSLGIVPSAGAMTFGGNDIGFAGLVKLCLDPKSSCADDDLLNTTRNNITALVPKLQGTYQTAWSAMNTPEMRAKRGGNYAPLFVLPYPYVVKETRYGGCDIIAQTQYGITQTVGFDAKEVQVANTIVEELDKAISHAVADARRDGYAVYYATDVAGSFRPNNTACEKGDASYINNVSVDMELNAFSETMHPKATGYHAETTAFLRWLPTAGTIKPDVSDSRINDNLAHVGPSTQIVWPTRYTPDSSMLLAPGGTLQVNSGGYQPGSPVTFTIHSTPTVLGTITADKDGDARGWLTIPDDVQLGAHQLVVSSISKAGAFQVKTTPAAVIAPTPWWVPIALGAAVLALLAAAVLAVVGLVRRRRAAPVAQLSTVSEPT
ncbi:VWA domain-containing protein [Leifsonia xyli]|uniref:VWA domain-containing protein n=1 Tax=Leifsonia xyli TaxID=1575 RepID=UPI001431D7F5